MPIMLTKPTIGISELFANKIPPESTEKITAGLANRIIPINMNVHRRFSELESADRESESAVTDFLEPVLSDVCSGFVSITSSVDL